MSDPVILDKIITALAEYLRRDAALIKENYHLRDDLGLDSMAVIELLYKIEETFNLQIPDEDLAGLTTVGSVAGYVEKRLAPARPAPPVSVKAAVMPKGKKR
ncbi:MAG: acyl carrier protein [Nitrospira sp. CR1.3]|nr:acyl carrier protein [Nitrospira sp. CR1.3]